MAEDWEELLHVRLENLKVDTIRNRAKDAGYKGYIKPLSRVFDKHPFWGTVIKAVTEPKPAPKGYYQYDPRDGSGSI